MIKEGQLELLGLSSKESRLYIAALTLESFTVADIAKKSGIKRPTCYVVLDEMTKKGLISTIPQAHKHLYRAEPPKTLIRQAKRAYDYAEKVVPVLDRLCTERTENSVVRFYYGQNGIRNIYEDIINSGVKVFRYIGSSGPLVETAGDEFMRDYVQRCVRKGIKRISIRMRETELADPVYADTKDMLREIRYAPKDIYIPDTVFIYKDKVAMIATTKGNFGLMISSSELAQTLLGLFEALWRVSTEK